MYDAKNGFSTVKKSGNFYVALNGIGGFLFR
jgi:hypothetical protein